MPAVPHPCVPCTIAPCCALRCARNNPPAPPRPAPPRGPQVVLETQSDWGYSLGIKEWEGATGEILGKNVEPLMGEKWNDFRRVGWCKHPWERGDRDGVLWVM